MKIKLKEYNQDPELNLEVVKHSYANINSFRKLLKGLKRDAPERKLIDNKLKLLRAEVKNYATMFFRIEGTNKRKNYYETFSEMPKASEIKLFKETFKARIKESRKIAKEIKIENKNVVGFQYKSSGGVMVESKTIFNLMKNTNPVLRVRTIKKPADNSKNNYVGVEIELIAKCEKDTIEHALIANGLAGYVRVGTDGSLRTEQTNEKAHELTVMCKQQDMKDVFNRLDKVLKIPYIGAYVNNSCGLHVHIDCRNRDHKIVYRNLVNSLPVLSSMISPDRIQGEQGARYCKLNNSNDFDGQYSFSDDRYWMVNPQSYNKYKTIEIRMHGGTTNPTKIVNWASLLVAIAEGNLESKVNTISQLGVLLGLPSKLITYMEKRTELFKSKTILSTRDDHFSTQTFEMAV